MVLPEITTEKRISPENSGKTKIMHNRGRLKRPWITSFVFETIRFSETVKTKIKNLASN